MSRVIDKVNDLLATMLTEADNCKDDVACEHIYELFNELEDWSAIWDNSDFDKGVKK